MRRVTYLIEMGQDLPDDLLPGFHKGWNTVEHETDADPENLDLVFPKSSKPLHYANRIWICDHKDEHVYVLKDRYSTKLEKI